MTLSVCRVTVTTRALGGNDMMNGMCSLHPPPPPSVRQHTPNHITSSRSQQLLPFSQPLIQYFSSCTVHRTNRLLSSRLLHSRSPYYSRSLTRFDTSEGHALLRRGHQAGAACLTLSFSLDFTFVEETENGAIHLLSYIPSLTVLCRFIRPLCQVRCCSDLLDSLNYA